MLDQYPFCFLPHFSPERPHSRYWPPRQAFAGKARREPNVRHQWPNLGWLAAAANRPTSPRAPGTALADRHGQARIWASTMEDLRAATLDSYGHLLAFLVNRPKGLNACPTCSVGANRRTSLIGPCSMCLAIGYTRGSRVDLVGKITYSSPDYTRLPRFRKML